MISRRSLFAVWLGLAVSWTTSDASADDWKIGTAVQPPSVLATFVDEFIKKTKEATNGAINIEPKRDFNEQALTDQVIRGRLEAGLISALGLAVSVPEMQVLTSPYLWASDEQRDWVTDKKVVPLVEKILDEKGLALIKYGDSGWNNVFCKVACTSPEAVRGVKVRVSPNAASKMFWDQLGANGVQLPLTEFWPALQSGVVNAGDLTYSFYLTTPAAESAPYYIFTHHAHLPNLFVANKATWEKLSPADREKLKNAAPTTQFMRDTMAKDEKAMQDQFQSKGGHPVLLSDAERAKWRAAVVPGLPALVDSFGGRSRELFEAIEAGKLEFASSKK